MAPDFDAEEIEIIEEANVGHLIDFWKHFRRAFQAQGASSFARLSDPEFYYCVIIAAVKAKWFLAGAPKNQAVRRWKLQEMEAVASPIWELYREESQTLDAEEKKDSALTPPDAQ